ncbi:MAG: 1-deoxy-D-xylulose-5-phosphate reductoisomerase [Turneriella sp.]|nr:1-deoxy-D-xylulose-5-phosphate reductoisomerase [Turneriella sp.]
MRRRLLLFGATGSIGDSTLNIVRRHPDDFELVGFTWHHNEKKAAALRQEFPTAVCFSTASPDAVARSEELLAQEHDFAIIAIVGAAGVRTTLLSARHSKKILLANKESLVVAGPLVMAATRASGAQLLPIDSEHNSLYRLLTTTSPDAVRKVYLTASGGPLLHLSGEEFHSAPRERVLRHPTWVMGQKITVDSAGLANKALEIIEAHYLFGLPYSQIDAVIHPQSFVHAMVLLKDGTVLQHASQPDMRYPIAWAMYHPELPPDTVGGSTPEYFPSLEFFPVDCQKFRAYALGRRAGEEGKYFPAVFNAANEAAVEAFLSDSIRFGEIANLIERALENRYPEYDYTSLDGLLQYDSAARQLVHKLAYST